MNLKELTWENHKKAERKGFASELMSGKIAPQRYYQYLTNQLYSYNVLEACLRECGFPELYWGVFRAEHIKADVQELEQKYGYVFDPSDIFYSTSEYVDRVDQLACKNDLNGLVAHMYVRHFGDMYGGAMIAKKVPGSGRYYQFENKEALKEGLRSLLSDSMAPEANVCFEFAIRLFEEMGDGRLDESNNHAE